MKKFIALLVALLLVTVSAFALAEDNSLAYIQEKGNLILGFDEAYPPFGFVGEDGEYTGFDIELATYVVCEKLGVDLILQPVNWDAKELELNNKNIDVIWSGMTITDERKELMSFTMPYVKNEQVVVVMAGSDIASIDDLAGKTLGTQAGSSSVDVLDANPDLRDSLGEINLYEDFVMAMMDLELGGVDCVLIDSTVAGYQISQKPDPEKFVVLDTVLEAEEYGIGVRLGEDALASAINAALIEALEDGTLAEIDSHWFANDVTAVADYAEQYK